MVLALLVLITKDLHQIVETVSIPDALLAKLSKVMVSADLAYKVKLLIQPVDDVLLQTVL
jgi:hypothetical protein